MEDIQYDICGRMKYHPEYHENHQKGYTTEELMYLCSTYGLKKRKEVAAALGRTESAVAQLVYSMRRNGSFDRFKEMAKGVHHG